MRVHSCAPVAPRVKTHRKDQVGEEDDVLDDPRGTPHRAAIQLHTILSTGGN